MTTLTTSREVRMPRRRGLMARALEQPPETKKDISNIDNFDSAISLSNNSTDAKSLDRVSSPSQENNNRFVQKKLKPTLSITFPEEDPPETANISPGVSSPSSDATRKRRVLSKQPSSEIFLNPIQENAGMSEESLSSTQHLRTGFFRTIKKQYPTVAFENLGLSDYSVDSGRGESIGSPRGSNHSQDNSSIPSLDRSSVSDHVEEEVPFMSSMARRRLRELRKVDPNKVDVATGLQWIRLELHEMREQDKALFLQLIKLHGTIKEIRTEMKFMEETCDSPFDSFDGAASYWWPRCNGSSVLPDFSSSDGAHLLTRQSRPPMRRGFSFHQPRSRTFLSSNLAAMNSGSSRSFSSSMTSSHGSTAL